MILEMDDLLLIIQFQLLVGIAIIFIMTAITYLKNYNWYNTILYYSMTNIFSIVIIIKTIQMSKFIIHLIYYYSN